MNDIPETSSTIKISKKIILPSFKRIIKDIITKSFNEGLNDKLNNKDMKPKFKKVVDAGNLLSTRLFLANEMMLDPRGKTFAEMRSYAESKFADLYDTHNGAAFNLDSSTWSENLLFNVKNELDSNFSRERLDYYCNLAKVVLKDKAENLDAEEKFAEQRKASAESAQEVYRCPYDNKKKVYTGITIGGVALTLAGLFIKKTAVACVVSTLGVIGMAVGGYMLYNKTKK